MLKDCDLVSSVLCIRNQELGARCAYYYWAVTVSRSSWLAEQSNVCVCVCVCVVGYYSALKKRRKLFHYNNMDESRGH